MGSSSHETVSHETQETRDTNNTPHNRPDDVENHHEAMNSWLPITASRRGTWWYSAFHNVSGMVGAGVLGLPFAISQLGWSTGITAILVSWLVTYYTLYQMVVLHESVPGKRFDRYSELGMHAFGSKFGYWIVMPQQMIVQVSLNIVYMVTGGKSLKKSLDLLFPGLGWIRQTYYIIFYAIIELLLSQTPNFHSLKGVSLLAAVMSCCYSGVAFVASIVYGVNSHHHQEVSYNVRSHTTLSIIFDVFNGLGTIAFAFAGHSVVLEIQATIPSTAEQTSVKPMWKGATVAYIVVALCYLSVAIAGFWAFGNQVEDDVLISLERPVWLISLANFMVFLHVVGSYQIFSMPVFDIMEAHLVQKRGYKPGRLLRLTARSVYVAITALVGILVPFFGGLLGFCGGLAFASTSYFIPCIIWLILRKPKRWSFHWIASWVCITIGVAITILAPIGGARQIILQARESKMFP